MTAVALEWPAAKVLLGEETNDAGRGRSDDAGPEDRPGP
jgi:hypothetical protein